MDAKAVWTFHALQGWDAFWLSLAAAGGIFYAVKFFRSEADPFRRWAVVGLRLAALALLVFFFFRPAVEWKARIRRPPLAVVVDASQSMGVRDAGAGLSRFEAAASWLARNKAALERRFQTSYFLLDKALRPVDLAALAQEKPRGAASDLNLIPRAAGAEAPLLLAFTDGRAGGGDKPFAPDGGETAPFVVGLGEAGSSKDLTIERVEAPSIAFKKSKLTIGVRVRQEGLSLKRIPVTLTFQGKILASQAAAFSGGSAEASLSFEPQETGLATYAVSVPATDGELNVKNNRREFTLDVARDRIRALYITGAAGPQYAFLRQQLKQNPTVDLVSFVILRDPEDRVPFADSELSLIPFPTQDVLLSQMPSFDLIIFEQFYYPLFGLSPQNMGQLRSAVQKGSGFLLIAEPNMLAPGSPYWSAPWDDLLPFWTTGGAPVAPPAGLKFSVKEPGHAAMAIGPTPGETERLWRELGPLPASGVLPLSTRPGATTLAEWRAGDASYPLIGAAAFGKGRTAMVMTMASWRWGLKDPSTLSAPDAYQIFWNNLFRWLTQSDESKPVRLEALMDSNAEGDVILKTVVKDVHGRPETGARVTLSLRGPDGETVERTAAALDNGEYIDRFRPPEPGNYFVRAQASVGGRAVGRDEKLVRAAGMWDENADVRPDFAALARFAGARGAFVPMAGLSMDWLVEKTEPLSWESTGKRLGWNQAWLLFLAAGCLLTEWTLRRLWGRL